MAEQDRNGPIFVLVAPQMGENIGAAARAMWNFGLDALRLVAPRDGWPNPRAEAMASGALGLLERASVAATTAEATADLSYILATTARPRELTKPVMTPERAMAEARARIAAGERVGVLFGPERAGLANADLLRAQALVSVPVNPEFPSLNLAQCALLMAYEWRRQGERVPEIAEPDRERRATSGEIDRFVADLVARLDQAGFFFPEAKRSRMVVNLDNLFRRAPLTDTDLRTLYGVVKALAEKAPRK